MNILLGKIGGIGTSFSDGYKEYGGDIIAKLFIDLANLHPENNYYLCTTNNISSVFTGFASSRKPKNLIEYYERQKRWCRDHNKKLLKDDSYKMLEQSLLEDNIQIDKIILQAACCSNSSLWDLTYVYDGTRLRQPLATCRNGAQLIYFASMHQDIECDWILDDPRIFLTYPVDFIKCPNKVISQSNDTVTATVCSGYGEASKELKNIDIKCTYSHLEKYFLKDKTKIDWRNDERHNKFIMTLHGLPDRAKLFKKWIYDYDSTIKAYGKNWVENATTRGTVEKLGIPFSNFENKPIAEMEDLMWDSKYTFIPPVTLRFSSFVTQKVWTMLYYGIIPFWCKSDYDTTNIYSDFPDFIKVETPEEMWAKIEFLETHPEDYKNLRNNLFSLLKDEYFNSDYILKQIDKVLNDKA